MKNIILFIVGFCLYITIECCFRGFSYPLMGICGGLCIVILDKINDKISWDIDLILQGCVGSMLITGMEFIIGEAFLCFSYFPRMWDYSNMPLNYKGIICVPFSLIWILLSIVAIFVADGINYYVLRYSPTPYYKMFGGLITIRFPK